ncbi:hypothetical protein JCM30471_29710 [Desulfuromonas carbonis]
MVSSFISMAIISVLLLCFKSTQWLGFIGAAVLGLLFPITTTIVTLSVAFVLYWFRYRKR